jgi:hypothetical protein
MLTMTKMIARQMYRSLPSVPKKMLLMMLPRDLGRQHAQ